MHSSDLNLDTFLPLREPTFYILLSLASGEKHGYAILKTIESLSRDKLRLSTGTLYEALSRLVDQGLIERVDTEASLEGSGGANEDQRSRTRKAYRITELGMRVLRAEMERMQMLISITRLHLNEKPS